MKVQQDSVEERSESPDLPEPLYEEVGDFGLQVLKSLETSFLSSSTAETQEVADRPRLRLVPMGTGLADHMVVPEPGWSGRVSEETGGGDDGEAECSQQPEGRSRRRRQLQGVCTPSQELLLQELSSAFTKRSEEEQEVKQEQHEEGEEEKEEEEKPYDV